jgi:hypothetical protein
MKVYDENKNDYYVESLKKCGVKIRHLFLDDYHRDKKSISFEGTEEQLGRIKILDFVDYVREMGIVQALS